MRSAFLKMPLKRIQSGPRLYVDIADNFMDLGMNTMLLEVTPALYFLISHH